MFSRWTCCAFVVFSCLAKPVMADVLMSIESHPAKESLQAVFQNQPLTRFDATGLGRRDYLSLIADNIDYFKQFQNDGGAIIDPATKKEVQYSTPAFAFAAALLVKDGKRQDLSPAAIKAFDCALTALVNRKAADNHPDFYIPLLMHAHRLLKDLAPPEQSQKWAAQLQSIDPAKIYRTDLAKMNWNIVSTSGECLRRADGLVDDAQRDAQMAYIEKSFKGHEENLTKFGLYLDPGVPLAYDAFSRLWLEDVMANRAYEGELAQKIGAFLDTGGLSTLLLISPSGEWASGGRSAFHSWNEAEIAAICEYNASRWHAAGRDDIAGAFKRAARLSLSSLKRWQRKTGELYIIKNRAEPEARFGYERYSSHSQYNLLPMAMLAMAYLAANDTIAERPIPAEVGGYVFDLRETFHKVVAAAGGYYILIDTAADPYYNATGLQRVHRTGVAFSPLSDTAAPDRTYEPKDAPKITLVAGIQWQARDGDAARWLGLGDFVSAEDKKAPLTVNPSEILRIETKPALVRFEIRYALADKSQPAGEVLEGYAISADGVEHSQRINFPPVATRLCLPALVNDCETDTAIDVRPNVVTITHSGAVLTMEVLTPTISGLRLQGPPVPCHLGHLRMLTADLGNANEAKWRISLDPVHK